MTMNFDEWPKFTKEFKRFSRKYKSLPKDLEEFKKVVTVVPLGNSKHFNVIRRTEDIQVVKARFFCKYLKGSSLRLIYAYSEKQNVIEFVEIYFKGDKENEDRERIDEYLKIRGG